MRVLLLSQNGTLVPPERVQAFTSRAFLYGDGLFETVAVIRGTPLFWKEHLLRLRNGGVLLGIESPENSLWESWWSALWSALPDSCRQDRMVLKLVVSRMDGSGYATPERSPVHAFLFLQDWPDRPSTYWNHGITAGLCPVPLQCGSPYLAVKSLNRLNQIMARRMTPAEWQEAVLLDREGCIREGIQTNILWRRGETIESPDLRDGGVPGIQRDAILSYLGGIGYRIRWVSEPYSTLYDVDEILFSNSLIGTWAVSRLEERPFPGREGHLASVLSEWQKNLGLGA